LSINRTLNGINWCLTSLIGLLNTRKKTRYYELLKNNVKYLIWKSLLQIVRLYSGGFSDFFDRFMIDQWYAIYPSVVTNNPTVAHRTHRVRTFLLVRIAFFLPNILS
jgi:hypothetical protein